MNENRVSVKEAAARLGMPEMTLRLCLQQGRFDFGTAAKNKRWSYYINRTKFENYLKN